MDYGYGCYGVVWYRSNDRSYWECYNSSYHWQSVVDDFGNLYRVSDLQRNY